MSEKDPTGSAPGHDHKIPVGLDFLRLLRQQERECEAAFDEWLPSAGEKAPKTIEALGTALSYLDRIASCWWGCDGGDHQRERIIGRAVSNTRAALLLLRSGYYDEALGVTRQIGEIANLLLLFMRDDEAFVEWAGLGDQARRRKFQAVRVRETLEALGFGMAMDEDLYRKLSGVSVHANPNTVPQGHNVFSIPTMGAVFQGEGTLVSLNHLARLAAFVLLYASSMLDNRSDRDTVLQAAQNLGDSVGAASIESVEDYHNNIRSSPEVRNVERALRLHQEARRSASASHEPLSSQGETHA